MIFSSLCEHTPKDIAFYILDFGSETMKKFAKFPQVGEVVFQEDIDKVVAVLDSVISESAGSACLITQDNGCLLNPYDLDGMASAIDNAMRMVRHKDTCDVKDNLMPFLFDDIINKVITEIKQ